MFNPTFKRPAGPFNPRTRSPTPPRAYVEPLSPPRPQPLEPQWAYPPLDRNAGRPQYAAQTPQQQRPRAESASYATHAQKRGHYRTPSTIDQLAEAALAASPEYNTLSHSRSTSYSYAPASGHAHGRSAFNYGAHGASEPPHKRSRSELLVTPQVGQLGSRPLTSYESLPKTEQNNRVEEAALLLNFRTNGGSHGVNHAQLAHPPQSHPHHSGARPHSTSDPRGLDGFRATANGQAPLLPPFAPQAGQTVPFVSSPPPHKQMKFISHDPQARQAKQAVRAPRMPVQNVLMNGAMESKPNQASTVDADLLPLQTSSETTDSLDSPAPSSEAPLEVPVQVLKKRGWPKGKPRSNGARKTMAEKAASKRGATGRKRKSTRANTEETNVAAGGVRPRRKSVSDAQVSSRSSSVALSARSKSVPREIPMQIKSAQSIKLPRKKHEVTSDTICAGCNNTRELARRGGVEVDDWISCNGCKNWFHLDCAGFKKAHEARDVDKFFCGGCEPTHGKTTYVRKSKRAHASVDYAELQRGVLKTSEDSVEHHYIQPIKDGTFQFDPESFPRMRPEHITRDLFEKSSAFTEPICIPAAWNPRPWNKSGAGAQPDNTSGAKSHEQVETTDMPSNDFEYDIVPNDGQDLLDMVMPQGLTVRQVANLVGPDYPLDVIDVKTQNSGSKWTLGKWADYYEEDREDKEIRNVISLEVSQTKLGRLLKRPKVVRDIDLQDEVWPQEEVDKGKFPKVQFYCLMSIADSYTDFHIDFGGSSVYYHILRGKKTFFFIPPKPKHLKAYEDWNDSPQQNYTFLPNITKECYRVDLSEGDTMLIPSGWIHAVWTPETSLVVGGNFLTRMSYKNQFRVVEIEKNNETPQKFRYPHFQRIMWYTTTKYLRDDPLPNEISNMFYEGKRFERKQPVWADFDGDIANNDMRPGAKNARYYSQAEIDGLPDLVNFIFRTVMVTMGRVEGISADKMKRVNASIPKGFGDPLELAKAFALWVAWKRGNEDPPAWAHPDAVLPNSQDDGPPKKLSARALKDMERKEAIAAYRAAGRDRQSARVLNKQQNALTPVKGQSDAQTKPDFTPVASANGTTHSASTPQQSQISNLQQPRMQNHHQPHQHQPQNTPPHQPHHQDMNVAPQHMPAPAVMAPAQAMMMGGFSLQHISTPKTSVLGPKRVACDACRKRRIKCKHKDLVVQAQANGDSMMGSPFGDGPYPHAPGSDIGEALTVSPPSKPHEHQDPSTNASGIQNGLQMNAQNGHGPLPGTNAYVNANIPMAMNGVPMFGEIAKRGRSKACFECRKSKRRCIHDENGNIDPVKASETPVPRGSASSKKRSSMEGGADSPLAKKPKQQSPMSVAPMGYAPAQQPTPPGQPMLSTEHHHHSPPHERHHHPTPPSHSPSISQEPIDSHSNGTTHGQPMILLQTSGPEQHFYHHQHHHHQHVHLDPNLYTDFQDSGADGPYYGNGFSYADRPQLYHLPSLEQIASEVLDMDDPRDDPAGQASEAPPGYQPADATYMTNGVAKTEASVDSAVSLLAPESFEEHLQRADNLKASGNADEPVDFQPEDSQPVPDQPPRDEKLRPSTAQSTSNLDNVPVFKPPAPVTRSPEMTRTRPASSNSVGPNTPAPLKRKRDSISELVKQTPPSAKKTKVESTPVEQDKESMDLAKALQQEDLGLRRRTSRG
ncbi:hypothetical protein K431DRAFT_291789 [Polychaeton citri CBS 116435]|uniref:JmjC domain-containing histone demethylation protein 1 n=1 Tax=Polychaeton citri CBS 116435 TaxID=1314669 RepID=A0A9P4QG75_9PEZI|nr:hypothetical protein K431DRAFT_291789 [Polychaeton citri CBS 116435]